VKLAKARDLIKRRRLRALITLPIAVSIAAACASEAAESDSGASGSTEGKEPRTSTVNTRCSDKKKYSVEQLAAAAKKEEGTLEFYFILGEEHNRSLFEAFRKKYPFADVRVTGGDPLQLIERIISENRSNQVVADMIEGGPMEIKSLADDNGLGIDYNPVGAKQAIEEFQLEGTFVTPSFFTFTPVYNTSVLSKEELPSSLEDLTKPEWKGRFGIDVEQIDWLAGELGHYGEEKGLQLMEKLAANDPVLFSGTEGFEQLAAGSIPLALNVYSFGIIPYMEKGAPLDFVPMDHVVAQPVVFIGVDSTDQRCTLKLFFEFLFSDEAQRIFTEEQKMQPTVPVSNPSVPLNKLCPEQSCELFVETSEVFGDFEKRVKQFQELFVGR
jgi:iron(III) transport system substrate-binding protein